MLLLHFMRQRAAAADLARDNAATSKTACRYLHEALDVMAGQAAELPEVVAAALNGGTEHLLQDGTRIDTDRIHDTTANGGSRHDRWCSGRRCHHGGLAQVVTDADGRPLWVSPVEPGRTHDQTAVRIHVLPLLHVAAGHGVPTLADKACIGTGAGIRVPVRRLRGAQLLERSTRGWNSCVNSARAFVEHGVAHLETRWRTLARISSCPWRISAIAATALALSRLENRC
ncbi:transposase family protein [Kineococcus arenarius]|uniref:transposase family protein n=1 Tax=unclassified Kineococcus TaxID=2621656 RepID=UPI003D7C899F